MGLLFEVEKQLSEFLRIQGHSASIKFLDKRLCEMGDLIIKSKIETDINFDAELLKQASADWPLRVSRVSFVGNLVHVWFDRDAAFRKALTSTEWEPSLQNHRNCSEQIYVEEALIEAGGSASVTNFRANALRKVLRNCFTHAGYAMIDREQLEIKEMTAPVVKIMFVQKKNKITREQRDKMERQLLVEAFTGPVLTGLDADDYIKRRSNDMQLIAQHRYGVRIHDVIEMQRIGASLGRSAAIVDVLQPKHSSTIDLRAGRSGITRTPTSSKGAAFILYNFARLASIFKNYKRKIEKEGCPGIPPAHDVDCSLLTDPEEWHLLYVYVIGFRPALERALGDGQMESVAPHHLLEFTFGLVGCFSKYYRRVRILTDNRPKLLPVMIARLHLLEAVYKVLQVLLELLDLEAIEEM